MAFGMTGNYGGISSNILQNKNNPPTGIAPPRSSGFGGGGGMSISSTFGGGGGGGAVGGNFLSNPSSYQRTGANYMNPQGQGGQGGYGANPFASLMESYQQAMNGGQNRPQTINPMQANMNAQNAQYNQWLANPNKVSQTYADYLQGMNRPTDTFRFNPYGGALSGMMETNQSPAAQAEMARRLKEQNDALALAEFKRKSAGLQQRNTDMINWSRNQLDPNISGSALNRIMNQVSPTAPTDTRSAEEQYRADLLTQG